MSIGRRDVSEGRNLPQAMGLARTLAIVSRAAEILMYAVPAVLAALALVYLGRSVTVGIIASSYGELLETFQRGGIGFAFLECGFVWAIFAFVWFITGYFARALVQRAQGSADSLEAPPAPPSAAAWER